MLFELEKILSGEENCCRLERGNNRFLLKGQIILNKRKKKISNKQMIFEETKCYHYNYCTF